MLLWQGGESPRRADLKSEQKDRGRQEDKLDQVSVSSPSLYVPQQGRADTSPSQPELITHTLQHNPLPEALGLIGLIALCYGIHG